MLRKNESDVFGRKKNTFMSLTSNQSQRLNMKNKTRRNQQTNYSFMPGKDDILSERLQGGSNFVRVNSKERHQILNQVSNSSLLMTDTRGDTFNAFANSKNFSPNNSSLHKLDKAASLIFKGEQ